MKSSIGIDASKNTLVMARGSHVEEIDNEKSAILGFLSRLNPQEVRFGIEATGPYGYGFACLAHDRGFDVYYLNPKDVKRYKDAVAPRAKTDRVDAEVIARFVEKEHKDLRPFLPLPENVVRLRTLLRRRGRMVSVGQAARMSLGDVKELRRELKALLARIDAILGTIDTMVSLLLKDCPASRRLMGVPGFGRLSTAAMVAVLESGEFRSDDAVVAFVGLDLRARDSGQSKGRRRLTKQGDSETRRLLYNAAMAAVRSSSVWKDIYGEHVSRGLSRTAAMVAVMRRLVRTAWSIHRHGTCYDEVRVRRCAQSATTT